MKKYSQTCRKKYRQTRRKKYRARRKGGVSFKKTLAGLLGLQARQSYGSPLQEQAQSTLQPAVAPYTYDPSLSFVQPAVAPYTYDPSLSFEQPAQSRFDKFDAKQFAEIAAFKIPDADEKFITNLENFKALSSGMTHTTYINKENTIVMKPFEPSKKDTFGSEQTGLYMMLYAQAKGVAPPSMHPPVKMDGKVYVSSKFMPYELDLHTNGKVKPGDLPMVKDLIKRIEQSGINFSRDAYFTHPDTKDIYIVNQRNVRCDKMICYLIDTDGAVGDLITNRLEFTKVFIKKYPGDDISSTDSKIVGKGFEIDLSTGNYLPMTDDAIAKDIDNKKRMGIFESTDEKIDKREVIETLRQTLMDESLDTRTKEINRMIFEAIQQINPRILLRRNKLFFMEAFQTHPHLFKQSYEILFKDSDDLFKEISNPIKYAMDFEDDDDVTEYVSRNIKVFQQMYLTQPGEFKDLFRRLDKTLIDKTLIDKIKQNKQFAGST